ncbi:apolipoprotein N-acyltransferase [Saccharopolyspora taberi]|uniref:Apolipoprotein N-acyltransferase n=1 Tax=Saccharopolyspora taberi TaxID=60895 RepID=A0ABN3VHZ9_9PSEU
MVVPTLSAQRRAKGGGDKTGGRSSNGLVWLRMLLAVAAGFSVYAVSPPHDVWWLVPIAFAAFVLVVHGRRARAGFGYGLLFGFSFMLPLLGWIQDFLGAQFGPWPWLGVAAVEALFFGLAGAGMARVSRLRAAPVWMAAVFVTAEAVRSSFPFGGFPWGRLAFTQARGALLPLASLGGAVLVSFAVALIGGAVAQIVLRARRRSGLVAPAVMVVVPVLAGLAVLPTVGTEANAGTAKVAIVQGNAPNIGLDLLYQDDVLHDNHMRAAEAFADDVDAGRQQRPDFVILPEQVGSWGPARTDPALTRISAKLGVPMLVGGLGVDQDGQLRNKIVRWDPATGAGAEYDKQHLVPFAETIPMRPVARLVSPFVDRFERDMIPGDRPGVLDAGPARVGVGMCYDVAYDNVFAGAAQEGATLLAVPTNNAWYGHSEMSYQQLAMSQLRAVEHSRSVVVAATSGVSAIVRPDGSIVQQTGQFTAQNLTGEVPLRSNTTLATRLGSAPMWAFAALGAGAVLLTLRRRPQDA